MDISVQISGGTIKEDGLKPPFIRKFDDKRRKRKVTITVTQFSCGGLHYFVTINEESNPILGKDDEGNPAWRLYYDDEEKEGEYITSKFNTVKQTESFIEEKKKLFPKNTHHHVDVDYTDDSHYSKEGG